MLEHVALVASLVGATLSILACLGGCLLAAHLRMVVGEGGATVTLDLDARNTIEGAGVASGGDTKRCLTDGEDTGLGRGGGEDE